MGCGLWLSVSVCSVSLSLLFFAAPRSGPSPRRPQPRQGWLAGCCMERAEQSRAFLLLFVLPNPKPPNPLTYFTPVVQPTSDGWLDSTMTQAPALAGSVREGEEDDNRYHSEREILARRLGQLYAQAGSPRSAASLAPPTIPAPISSQPSPVAHHQHQRRRPQRYVLDLSVLLWALPVIKSWLRESEDYDELLIPSEGEFKSPPRCTGFDSIQAGA